jgi:predicted oxidoreductase
MGMAGTWNPAEVDSAKIDAAVAAFKAALDAGINFFDHADIYGGTACESIFKNCLAAVPGAREKIVIATKCGIRSGFYELDADYIRRSIDGSLNRMGLDYVDIYQMHRPDPFTHPRETAKGLKAVLAEGLVKHIGVSNYFPEQIRALQAYLDGAELISNQISISLGRLEPIYEGELPWLGSGILDFQMSQDITPLAYSPLWKGWLSGKRDVPADQPALAATVAELKVQAEAKNATSGQVALAWLLAHPAGIIPLIGSNNPAHIAEGAGAVNVPMPRQDWYKLWTAARGKGVM